MTERLRGGFTLIELMVVIAIIAILAGVMMVSFGGATSSARAALCITNMKNLAQAANTYAMQSGYYPLAGSRESVSMGSTTTTYSPQTGWISWLDKDKYDDGNGNKVRTAHVGVEICPFYGTGDDESDIYAITNGTLWKATAYNRKLYTCPEHVRYRGEKKLKTPLWSYVMSARFGYDTTRGSGSAATDGACGVAYNSLSRADRVLLFAELPTVDPETRQTTSDPSSYAADCTLQYRATVNGIQMGDWDGEVEAIGFPHKLGKRDYCGHVVFADGHTETLKYNEKGLSLEDLTAVLCQGYDIAYDDGAGYKLPSDADEMEDE